MKIGLLHALLRRDDKLLVKELENRTGINVVPLDLRSLTGPGAAGGAAPVGRGRGRHAADIPEGVNGSEGMRPPREGLPPLVLVRSIEYWRGLAATRLLEAEGVRCINPASVTEACGDKMRTSQALDAHGVPQPHYRVALSEDRAVEAMEEMGFPVVLKPVIGSWGRLLARVNDRDAAEALLEHKTTLGSFHHSVFYIQEYVPKAEDYDIRAFTVGRECIAAIRRHSEHWITNTARGARTTNQPVTDEVATLAVESARAVGADLAAVDLMASDRGLLVTEVNATAEFKNSIEVTGVDIPARMVDHVLKLARSGDER